MHLSPSTKGSVVAVALLLTTATVLLATNLRDVETEVGDERSRVPVGAVVATPSVRSEPSTSRPTPSPSPTEVETAREVADPVRRTAHRPTRKAPERSAATTPTPRPVRTPARPAPSPEPDPLTALVSTILGG